MNRREFLAYTSGATVGASLSRVDQAFAVDATPTGWRTFEVTTRVEVLKPSGSTRVWLPAALPGATPFQKTLANDFKAEGGNSQAGREPRGRARDDRGGVPGRDQAGRNAHESNHNQELRGGSIQTWPARQGRVSGIGIFSATDETYADGRNCQDNGG